MGGAKGWDSVLATGRASLPIAAGKWEERGGEGRIGDLVLTQIWPSNLDSVTGLWNVLSDLVYRRHKEPSIKRTPEGREARFNSEPRLSVPWVLRGCCRTFLGFTVEMFVVSRGVYTRVFSVFRQHVRTGAVSSVLLSGCSLPRARVSVSQPTSAQVTPGLSLPSDPYSALSSGVSSSASDFLSNAQPDMPHTHRPTHSHGLSLASPPGRGCPSSAIVHPARPHWIPFPRPCSGSDLPTPPLSQTFCNSV